MSIAIAGLGWVTPLGSGIKEVWDRLLAGEMPQPDEVRDAISERSYPAYRVPSAALQNLPAHSRLRRASAISRFAAAAGLAALRDAQVTADNGLSKRLALIFAVANGGVIYTKRFYSDIVKTGADAASPLLFPETVFNAAASHLAAIIGLSGATYTLVGDGSVGLSAIQMAEELLGDDQLDYCLVVAPEEADWLLCDAYHKWRLLRSTPPIELFGCSSKGTILSEGAGALLLSRNDEVTQIAATTAGRHFGERREAPTVLSQILKNIGAHGNVVIGSANGTFVDAAEARAVDEILPGAELYSPKAQLGEGVAASGLWQVIVAAQVLRTKRLPQPHYRGPIIRDTDRSCDLADCNEVTVLCCGLNQQAGGTRLVTTI
jgi:3-oxoacyl-(acyl-carrier-protein) synthase